MAKKKRNLEINAGNTPKEIEKVGKAVEKLNAKLAEYNTTTNELFKTVGKTNTRFETLRNTALDVNRKLKSMAGRTETLNTNITNLSAAARNTVSSLDALIAGATRTNHHFKLVKDQLISFRRNLEKNNAALERERDQLNTTNRSLRSFNSLIEKITNNMAGKNSVLRQQTRRTKEEKKAVEQLSSQFRVLGLNMGRVRDIFVSFVGFRFFNILSRQIIQSVSDARDWARAVSEIRTISDRAAVSTEKWREQLIGVSNAYGTGFVENAEAAYQALSNQVVEAENATRFLREEVKLSITAVSTLDEAVSTTTAVMNAFGLEAEAASRVNDVLFTTVEEGRTRLSELATPLVEYLLPRINWAFHLLNNKQLWPC